MSSIYLVICTYVHKEAPSNKIKPRVDDMVNLFFTSYVTYKIHSGSRDHTLAVLVEERVQFDPGGVAREAWWWPLGSQQSIVSVPRPVVTPGLTGLRVAGDPGVPIVAADHVCVPRCVPYGLLTGLTAVAYHSPLPIIRCRRDHPRLPRLQAEELGVGASVRVRNSGDTVIIAAELPDNDEGDGAHDEEN